MEMFREETFGPLVGIMRVRSEEEALSVANDSHLGLNATVFGPARKARAFADRLQTGNAIVNDVLVNYLVVEAPLGGVKASGIGVRHGAESIRQWTRTESVTVPFAPLAPVGNFLASKLAFPYDRRVLALLRRSMRVLYGRGLKRKFGPLPG
jgi:acyl-CoA reductase-like NAD-dependent aldehyde dehydrogenase